LLDYGYQKTYPFGTGKSVAIQKVEEKERKAAKEKGKGAHVLIFSANKCIARRCGLWRLDLDFIKALGILL